MMFDDGAGDRCLCCESLNVSKGAGGKWPQCKECSRYCPNYATECQRERMTKRVSATAQPAGGEEA